MKWKVIFLLLFSPIVLSNEVKQEKSFLHDLDDVPLAIVSTNQNNVTLIDIHSMRSNKTRISFREESRVLQADQLKGLAISRDILVKCDELYQEVISGKIYNYHTREVKEIQMPIKAEQVKLPLKPLMESLCKFRENTKDDEFKAIYEAAMMEIHLSMLKYIPTSAISLKEISFIESVDKDRNVAILKLNATGDFLRKNNSNFKGLKSFYPFAELPLDE